MFSSPLTCSSKGPPGLLNLITFVFNGPKEKDVLQEIISTSWQALDTSHGRLVNLFVDQFRCGVTEIMDQGSQVRHKTVLLNFCSQGLDSTMF